MAITVATITLRIAREITDVLVGKGTISASPATSMTDSTYLIQPAGHWEGGTVWMLSGTGVSGKAGRVTSYAPPTINFDSLGAITPTINPDYALSDKHFPLVELIKFVNMALEAERPKVLASDTSLVGDGSTLEFTLPTGVEDIVAVERLDSISNPKQVNVSKHWKERAGKLIFNPGRAPSSSDKLRLWYRAYHGSVFLYSDVINAEVDEDWLLWKAVEQAMIWGIQTYGDTVERNYATKLQYALDKLLPLKPVRDLDVIERMA